MLTPALEDAYIEIFGKLRRVSGYAGDAWFTALKQRGKYDFEFDTEILKECVGRSDAVCLDIGANIGVLTLAMAELCPKGQVIAFEASEAAFVALAKNCADATRIVVGHEIIGHHGDQVSWVEDMAELSSAHYVLGGHRKTISIDSLNLPRVNFIKIDVEGAELEVLYGAEETLERCKPKVILEFNTFAFVHYRNIMPRVALKRIRQFFSSIEVLPKRGGGRFALPPEKDEEFLRYNFLNGLVDDLLCVV